MAALDLMPRQLLLKFQNQLSSLKNCFILTETELEILSVCPHCHSRPSSENVSVAGGGWQSTDGRLGGLIAAWTKTFLGNLKDPITWST
jgi:hypothetical protein